MIRRTPRSTRTDTLFPYTTLFRSPWIATRAAVPIRLAGHIRHWRTAPACRRPAARRGDRFHRPRATERARLPASVWAPHRRRSETRDRKSVVSGKGVSVRVGLGGPRLIQKTTERRTTATRAQIWTTQLAHT